MPEKRSREITLVVLGVAAVVFFAANDNYDDDCTQYHYTTRDECAADWSASTCEPHDGHYDGPCISSSGGYGGGSGGGGYADQGKHASGVHRAGFGSYGGGGS